MLTIKDFGAISGNGLSDKAAFDKAIEFAPYNNKIIILPGEYYLSSNSDVTHNLQIEFNNCKFKLNTGDITEFARLRTNNKVIFNNTEYNSDKINNLLSESEGYSGTFTVHNSYDSNLNEWVTDAI